MTNLKISKKIFNTVYLPYLTDYSKRDEIYYGGAGSGKSVFIVQKLIIKLLNDPVSSPLDKIPYIKVNLTKSSTLPIFLKL